jgi:hypothetical protein
VFRRPLGLLEGKAHHLGFGGIARARQFTVRLRRLTCMTRRYSLLDRHTRRSMGNFEPSIRVSCIRWPESGLSHRA